MLSGDNVTQGDNQISDQPPVHCAAKPIAQGEADFCGLSSAQVNLMFAKAFEQAAPFPDHQAICLSVLTNPGRFTSDPSLDALDAFRSLTNLPVLPASHCAFDVYPTVIETGAKAMLYQIEIKPKQGWEPLTFWASAIYGNLGANGREFTMHRGARGWYAKPTGLSVIS